MQPYKVEFYLYANSQSEIDQLQAELRTFVETKRQEGIGIDAQHLMQALKKFSNNYFVTQYLKKKL